MNVFFKITVHDEEVGFYAIVSEAGKEIQRVGYMGGEFEYLGQHYIVRQVGNGRFEVFRLLRCSALVETA